MVSKIFWPLSLIVLPIGLLGCERQVSFADDVQPIFDDKCVSCHDKAGEGHTASGFSVVDYDSVMKGTKFGPVVISKSRMSSALYLVVAQKTAPEIQMPPHHEESFAMGRAAPLSEAEVKIIGDWIEQGAKNN